MLSIGRSYGLAHVKTADRAMVLGVFTYLLKPIEIDQLLYKIQDAHQIKKVKETMVHKQSGSTYHTDGQEKTQKDS